MCPMLKDAPMRSSFPKLHPLRIRSQAINDAEDLSSHRNIDGTIYAVEPEAWVSAAMDRLTVLCALKPNWDEGTAAPVHPDVYEFVHRFLADIRITAWNIFEQNMVYISQLALSH